VNNRDPTGKDFDPSSFDDVLALVSAWTNQRSMTASEIAEGLRARGVVARATTSGRHLIVTSPTRRPGARPEAQLVVVPAPLEHVRRWFHRPAGAPHRAPRVIRPPGQALHRVAGLFSKRTRERVLDPIIADMQLEYCEALADERPRRIKLWLVQLRAWVAFAEAVFLRTVVGRILKGIPRLV
jgi:hypothetical protein